MKTETKILFIALYLIEGWILAIFLFNFEKTLLVFGMAPGIVLLSFIVASIAISIGIYFLKIRKRK